MPRGARDRADRLHRLREQRAEDDLGAFVDRLLPPPARAVRIAAIVLDQQLDVRIVEFGEREFGGVLHRLRREPGIAGRRQRQDQRDLDLASADLAAGLRRRGQAIRPLADAPVPATCAGAAGKRAAASANAGRTAESPPRHERGFRNDPDTANFLNDRARAAGRGARGSQSGILSSNG